VRTGTPTGAQENPTGAATRIVVVCTTAGHTEPASGLDSAPPTAITVVHPLAGGPFQPPECCGPPLSPGNRDVESRRPGPVPIEGGDANFVPTEASASESPVPTDVQGALERFSPRNVS
jgi:hypothetical protein